ncbi:MAG TPA: peptidoglycan DD-metalloendopeptidase family protein [Kofleriaceae bacterium]|nr:peptidoglycan DD-metalloendopeptidase family protein [Kofleriaceae bacterium]
MKTDALAGGAAPPQPDPAARRASDVKSAAKQLEAFFLRQMLSEAKPQGGGAIDGGFAGDTFKQMMDDALADKMSAAGGIGLSKMFAQQLAKAAGGQPADETAAPPIGNAPVSAHAIADQISALSAIARPQNPELAGAPALILPVAGRASSGYGLRADPIKHEMINHPGFDLAAPTGTQVHAAAGGTVVHAGPAGTYGNLVTVRHDNGFETRYAHLSEVDVKQGDTVAVGQDVGKVGTTGYSTGPHLHFELRRDGKPIDPAPLLPLTSPLHSSPVRTSR